MTLKHNKNQPISHYDQHMISSAEQLFVDTLRHCEEQRLEHMTQDTLEQAQSWITVDSNPDGYSKHSSPKHHSKTKVNGEDISQQNLQWCWLLSMADKLGINRPRAIDLAASYPYLANQMRRQIDQMTALAKAQRADQQDHLNRALLAYLQHLASIPYDESIRLILGRLLLSRGEVSAAQAIYKTGLDVMEGSLLIALQAEISIFQGSYHQAHMIAKAAWEHAPQDVEVLLTLAQSYHWQGRFTAKKDCLERALQYAPRHPLALAIYHAECPHDVHINQHLQNIRTLYQEISHRAIHQVLVKTLIQAELNQEALKEAKLLHQRHKQHKINHILLATCYILNAQLDKADELQSQMDDSYQQIPQKYVLDWFLSYHHNEKPQAREDILLNLKQIIHESPYWLSHYARYLDAEQKHDVALQIYSDLLQIDPENIQFLLSKAQNLILLKQYKEAITLCREILRLSPQCVDAMILQVDLALIRNDPDDALLLLSHCTEHIRAPEIYIRLHLMRGDYKEALDLLNPLIQQRPLQIDLLEYWINAVWQSEEDCRTWLLDLYHRLLPVTQREPLLILLGYLLSHLGCQVEAQAICEQVFENFSLQNLSKKRMRFACEMAFNINHVQALFAWSELAVERFPNESYFWLAHAHALWEEERINEALAIALGGLNQANVELEDLIQVGNWFYEAQRPLEAIEICNRLWAHENQRQNQQVQVLCISIYLHSHHQERIDQAVEIATQLFVTTQEANVYEHLITCAMEAKLFEIAYIWSQHAINEYSDHASIWRLHCLIEQVLDRHEDALSSAFAAFNQDSKSVVHQIELAKLLEKNNRIDEAKFFYQQAINNQVIQSDALLEYACFLIRHQHNQEANSIFEDFLKLYIDADQASQSEDLEKPQDLAQQLQESLAEALAQEEAIDVALEHALEQMLKTDNALDDEIIVSEDLPSSNNLPNTLYEELMSQDDLPDYVLLEEVLDDNDHVIDYSIHSINEDDSLHDLFTSIDEPSIDMHMQNDDVSMTDLHDLSDEALDMINAIIYLWLTQSYHHNNVEDYNKLVVKLYERFTDNPLLDGFLGLSYLWQGKISQALPLLQNGSEHVPYFIPEYTQALWNCGERSHAIYVLQKAIIKMPDESQLYRQLLGYIVDDKQGNYALEILQTIILLEPDAVDLDELYQKVYALLKPH